MEKEKRVIVQLEYHVDENEDITTLLAKVLARLEIPPCSITPQVADVFERR